jgi:hypothetical protein
MRTTQLEAHEAIQGHALTIRQQVMVLFQEYGGMTDEDLVDIYHAVHDPEVKESTIRARRIELTRVVRRLAVPGDVVDTGETKLNRSGRRAVVWDLV